MNNYKELAKQKVNEKLKNHEHRLTHTYGVRDTAVKLAKIYHVDENKIEIAGLFHDYAKYDNYSQMYLTQEEKETVKQYPVMFHAYQAAHLVKEELGLDDKEIMDAIRCHVWGKPNMTDLEKILFISDFCEPNRNFEDTQMIFDMASKNLDKAVLYCMEVSIKDLLQRDLKPSKAQIEAYLAYGGTKWNY